LDDYLGWRKSIVCVNSVGLLLACMALLIKEPNRGAMNEDRPFAGEPQEEVAEIDGIGKRIKVRIKLVLMRY
jgi:hypothetical protein